MTSTQGGAKCATPCVCFFNCWSKMSLLDHFPFKDREPYKYQVKVFEAIEAARAAGTPGKVVLLRGPTGCGKSAIAATLALEAVAQGNSAHILASHRFLQSQYLNDFAKYGFKNLWGKKNYVCQVAESKNVTSAYGPGIASCQECCAYRHDIPRKFTAKVKGKKFIELYCTFEKTGDLCLYLMAKERAAKAAITLTNYNSFLAHTFYAKTFERRQLLIVDEAHLLADRLAGFLTTEIPLLDEWVKTAPRSPRVQDHLKWLETTLLKSVSDDLDTAAKAVSSGNQDVVSVYNNLVDGDPQLSELQAGLPAPRDTLEEEFIKLYRLREKVAHLIDSSKTNPEYWVVEINERRLPGVPKFTKVLEYKPVKVGKLAEAYLFKYGAEVVLMSATLNTGPFLNDLGLSASDIKVFLDLPSVFPLATRPIIEMPVGSMAKLSRDATLPKIVTALENLLLNVHPHEKGVIHLHSFKNGKDIHDGLSPAARARVIWHLDSATTRVDDLIDTFFASESKWLASPAVVEGLDGKDDRVRAQVLLKAPYPYLGSAQVAARKNLPDGNAWFVAQAANSIVQAYGRGTRHKEDYSVLYVLDTEIRSAILRAGKIVPAWFSAAWAQAKADNWIMDTDTERWVHVKK